MKIIHQLFVASLIARSFCAHAQGVIQFSNVTDEIDAPVYAPFSNDKATSPPYSAGLVVDNQGAFTYVSGSTVRFSIPGYVDPHFAAIPGHEGGTSVTLRMIAFRGTSDEDAVSELQLYPKGLSAVGISNPVTVTLPGNGELAPTLLGLQSFQISALNVPEPSVTVIGVLGSGLLLLKPKSAPTK